MSKHDDPCNQQSLVVEDGTCVIVSHTLRPLSTAGAFYTYLLTSTAVVSCDSIRRIHSPTPLGELREADIDAAPEVIAVRRRISSAVEIRLPVENADTLGLFTHDHNRDKTNDIVVIAERCILLPLMGAYR